MAGEMTNFVNQLGKIRNIPQFLFCDEIIPKNLLELRTEIINFKNNNGASDEIDFILNSPGGSPSDAYRIIRTLRNNFQTINIIVPFWAKSAATLIALGGTNIIMDEFGEFGPLDIQLAKEREDSPYYERESALNDEHSLKRIEIRARELFQSTFMQIYSTNEVPIT